MTTNNATICKMKLSDIFGVLLVTFMMILPMTSIANICRIGISLFLLLILIVQRRISGISYRLLYLFWTMIGGLLLPLIAVSLVEGSVDLASWFHEFQRIGFYCILIFVVYHYRVSFDFVFWICVFILLFNTTIQVLQFVKVDVVFDFLRRYYTEDGQDTLHLTLAYGSSLSSFRSGSIFFNPNVYMVIPLASLAVFLQRNMRKFSVLNFLMIGVALFSLLLTGSRTAFIIAVVIVGLYFVREKRLGIYRWLVLFVVSCVVIYSIFILSSQYRSFDIISGLTNSLGTKVSRLSYYITNANLLYLIFGSLSSYSNIHMDAEWGYIYSYFGILGYVWYIQFLKLLSRNFKTVPLLTRSTQAIICLVAMTASVVLCMPVFPFFCLICVVDIFD